MHAADFIMLTQTPYQRRVHDEFEQDRSRVVTALLRCVKHNDVVDFDEDDVWLEKQAARIAMCCRGPMVYSSTDGDAAILTERRCRSRLCPRCTQKRSRELLGKLYAYAKEMDEPRFLTLTLVSTDAPLRDEVIRLRKAFANLRRTPEWKRHVNGGLYTVEVTYNRVTKQWHPHLHAVIDGVFFKQSIIKGLWFRITGDSTIVDIRPARNRRDIARYITGYISKSSDVERIPDGCVAEWARELFGLRFVARFGSLHAVKLPADEPGFDFSEAAVVGDANRLQEAAERGDVEACQILDLLTQGRSGLIRQDGETEAGATDVQSEGLGNRVRRWYRAHPPPPLQTGPELARAGPKRRLRDHTLPFWPEAEREYLAYHGGR